MRRRCLLRGAAIALSFLMSSASSAQPSQVEDRPGFAHEKEAGEFQALCRTVQVENATALELKDMETRLLCGDPTPDRIGIAWSSVPPSEAAYFSRGFLQTRGFHAPTFIQDGEILFVRPGPLSRLGRFTLTGGPATWAPPRRRLVEGQRLAPKLLDELQGWALSQIKNEGYPCALAQTRADPATGEVVVNFEPGDLKSITGIENAGDSGLSDGALNRYNAFRFGDLYRERLVALTRRRTQEDGFLQSLTLNPRCETGGVTLVRDVVLGPSRTVSIGAGGSSDEGARLRFVLRQNRIGDSASQAQARADLSYLNQMVNRQTMNTNYRWFYSPGEPRSFLEPEIRWEHFGTPVFENQSFEAKTLHGWTTEVAGGQFEFRGGPTFLDSKLFRGRGPSDVSVTFAETNARWTDHDFEYFAASPRTGGAIHATALLTLERWGANFTAQKLEIHGQKLWSIENFDPPLLVLGTRFGLSSVFSPNEDLTPDLPIRFLTFLGGDPDLRGFERVSLPRSGVGALSGATGGLEARLHKVLFRRADVFTFCDAGMLGRARFQLLKPILMSPGAGVRWESPIGVLRIYVAERFPVDEPPDEVAYEKNTRIGLTYGEEF